MRSGSCNTAGVWTCARDLRFGGLSGLDISPDGRQLISVTDRGNWFTAQLNYNRDGRLVGMSDTIMMPIRAANGTPLTSPSTIPQRCGDHRTMAAPKPLPGLGVPNC